MNKQQLQDNCKVISKEIDKEVFAGDISGAQEKLLRLSQLISLSAECMKQAKENYLYRQMQIIQQNKDSGIQASIFNRMVESEAWEESGMYTYCDRLNAGISHACDNLRTVISLYKTEMQTNLKG